MTISPTINVYSVRIAQPPTQHYFRHPANKDAAYAAGGMFAALCVSMAATGLLTRKPAYAAASLSSACLTTSMFLLASSNNTHKPMIQAHLVLAYVGGHILILASSLMTNSPIAKAKATRNLAVSIYQVLGAGLIASASVLDCIGVLLLDHPSTRYRSIGRALHLTAACCALATSCAGLPVIACLWVISRSATRICADGLDLITAGVFLVLWSGFSVAQAPTDDGATTANGRQEMLWYLLGVLPLALAQVAWLVSSMSWTRVLSHFLREQDNKQKADNRQKQWSSTIPLDFSYPMRSGGGRPGTKA
ncbi:hypothetical protein H4R99_000633 [Coemansia sp. RSA 1722]|nr:hypothetical protein IWW45_000516 [Coemansia sp. RSA 485]KAJ2606080.1 hypothetical protein H4R99_000633 [Coemansia sp. RSA 1722]KAJ2634721.1 hypothetical protein GGF40_004033 [Coemansia sp. RSA 1286]